MLIARVVLYLVAAVLWALAAVWGSWAARRLRRVRTRMRVYLLVSLGLVVAAYSLVDAMDEVHPLGAIRLGVIALLVLAGAFALVLNVTFGERLARDEELLRVLSHDHLDVGESVTHRASQPLSSREVEVLGRLCRGQTTDRIAAELYLSKNTVETHVRNLRGKLGASSRAEAIGWAVRTGMYDPDTGTIRPPTRENSHPNVSTQRRDRRLHLPRSSHRTV